MPATQWNQPQKLTSVLGVYMKLCRTKNNHQKLWWLPCAREDWKNWSHFSSEMIKSDLFIHSDFTIFATAALFLLIVLLNLSFTPYLQNITLVRVEHCSDSLHWLTAVLIHAEINMRLQLNLGYYCFPVLFKRFVYISSACRHSRNGSTFSVLISWETHKMLLFHLQLKLPE